MILRNPTDQEVSIIFNGRTYSIEPMSTSGVLPEDAGQYWKSVHQFLSIVEAPEAPAAKAEPKAETKEEPEEKVEAPEEESPAPKKPAAKKAK